ncbi:MAG: Uma2 family endonuclease [Planctomycetia bacterium]|nr:Uma2 family endonuclease [Planctomycetia bacterium]
MPTILAPFYGAVHIPSNINDLSAFRRWVHFAELPEKLPIHFLRGDVWMNCARTDSLANVLIRGALIATLHEQARTDHSGTYVTAGMLWSNDQAGFATLPDGFFISKEALKTGRVRFSNGGNPKAHATEVIGTPDLVIEIVSDESEEKDTDWLMSAYSLAGVPEYWLIDARGKRLRFDILAHSPRGYRTTRKVNGWIRSTVFQKTFQLVRSQDQDELPKFTLEVR